MIIESLLDNDHYKFSMGNFAFSQYPNTFVEYKLKIRNRVQFTVDEFTIIQSEIEHYLTLQFTFDDKCVLCETTGVSIEYLNWLCSYYNTLDKSNHVRISLIDGDLNITVKGLWAEVILHEVPLLAIISEVYKRQFRTLLSVASFGDFNITDFGTRRRYSREFQEMALLAAQPYATSNVLFSHKLHIPCVGTMAHELFQVAQVEHNITTFQEDILAEWYTFWKGKYYMTALTDIVGVDAFLKIFKPDLMSKYHNIRHDSGNAIDFIKKVINHYKKHNIDCAGRSIIFSDCLNLKEIKIIQEFIDSLPIGNSIMPKYAVGTSLTNPLGTPSFQAVIKLVRVNGKPVAKLSDSPGKGMCEDASYEKLLRSIYCED